MGDPTACVKCNNGGALPNCILADVNCTAFDPITMVCTTCAAGFGVNHKGVCVKAILNQSTCDVYFNSTTCFDCSGTNTKLRSQNNDESEYIGLCVAPRIDGCVFATDDHAKCLRCASNKVLFNGICLDTEDLPAGCGQIQYDQNKKTFFCKECNKGWAIDGNYTTCTANLGECADISGGNDCALLDQLAPYGTAFKCKDYGRSSASIITFSALVALFLYIFI